MTRLALVLGLFLCACSGTQQQAHELGAQAGSKRVSAGSEEPVERIDISIEGQRGAVQVRAEIADTPSERARGLMYRESLAEGTGMLFVYQRRDVHTFWMKNTLIPLDMLFLDGPPHQSHISVIGIVHNAEPETLTHRSVSAPSLFVLEVPGGWARKMGISEGSRVSWEGLPTPPSGVP